LKSKLGLPVVKRIMSPRSSRLRFTFPQYANPAENKSIYQKKSICIYANIEEQTTQWSKEKGRKDKQRSTKHTHKTKDRVTRTQLKTEGGYGSSGMVGRS
jgi:hypothetical protein